MMRKQLLKNMSPRYTFCSLSLKMEWAAEVGVAAAAATSREAPDRKWLLQAITFSHICHCTHIGTKCARVCRQIVFERSVNGTSVWKWKMQQITFLCDLTDQRIQRYCTLQTEKTVCQQTYVSLVDAFVQSKENVNMQVCAVQHSRSVSVLFLVFIKLRRRERAKEQYPFHSIPFNLTIAKAAQLYQIFCLSKYRKKIYKWNCSWTCDRSYEQMYV